MLNCIIELTQVFLFPLSLNIYSKQLVLTSDHGEAHETLHVIQSDQSLYMTEFN